MPGLDFKKLGGGSTSESATEPRRIFSALPSKIAKYGYARDVQSEVWHAWHERRDGRDVMIKMNTGGGKTVVGLIALKSALNERVGPAAYITPDVYLAGQVRAEAEGLGLEITSDPDSARFRQGHAILVANVYKLFNGLSVFGVKGSTRPIVELGTVLIDDAHACLATLEEQFTLTIPAEHAGYEPLLDLFDSELAVQSEPTLRDIRENDLSAVLPVPFWAWADKQKAVLEILHPHRKDDELKFVWPLISEALPLCRVAVSASGFEIAPPCPPVEMIPSFARARRRIYLTATLADDSVLVTHFGADPDLVRKPVTPHSADDLGDRMILTPSQTFPGLGEEKIRDFLLEQSATRNVVVIVPSWARAHLWEAIADAIHGAETLQAGLAALREGHVGLVVLVNKYDGIDLPGDACRILALDGLPEALGILDRLDTVALEGSDTLLARQIQRIEQGMGRGVRSNDDYCVVMLLGKRLTARLYPPQARARFSPATRAQLDLSDQVAGLLRDKPFSSLSAVVEQCLQRDQAWVAASRDALDGLEYPAESDLSRPAIAQREAFELTEQQRFTEATVRLQEAVDAMTDRLSRGMLKQQAAAYLHQADPSGAQRLQRSALSDNRGLIKPRQAVSYVPLKSAGSQAQTASKYLSARYGSGEELALGFEAVIDQLVPDPDAAAVPRFEQAVCDIALHLGLGAQRPERDTGRGPDVLWLLGQLSFLVIECKSGSTAKSISREDLSQLSHSMDWFAETYDPTCKATPVLVHPTRKLHGKASARAGTRIITFEKLDALRSALSTFATSVANEGAYADAAALATRLRELGLHSGGFIERWSAQPTPARS
jgi:hypothetical protein